VKLPRDWGGEEVIRCLARFGYRVTRQTGAHVRLTTALKGEHHLTIPWHKPLKVGTLRNILGEAAHHLDLKIADILESE